MAQLDRASVYGTEGSWFDPTRARSFFSRSSIILLYGSKNTILFYKKFDFNLCEEEPVYSLIHWRENFFREDVGAPNIPVSFIEF